MDETYLLSPHQIDPFQCFLPQGDRLVSVAASLLSVHSLKLVQRCEFQVIDDGC
jgi:hypothetical protein